MGEIIATIVFIAIWVVLTTLALAIVNILPLPRSVVWKDKIGGIAMIAAIVATVLIWLWLDCRFFAWEFRYSQWMTCLRLGFWP